MRTELNMGRRMEDEPTEGQRVHAYYNIPKDTVSVRNTSRRVILHRPRVILKDAEFRVSERGRRRVIEEQCKNVHAMVYGYWVEECPVDCSLAVRYNPYEDPFFKTVEEGERVEEAEWAIIHKNRCFIPE